MAWSTPSTRSTGYIVQAADWNELVNDLIETAPAKVTTAGDLVYGTGANAISRLAVGGAGALLQVASGAPAWLGLGGTAGDLLRVNAGTTAAEWFTPGYYESGDTIVAAVGGSATPGLTFTGFTDDGLYHPADGQVAVALNGVGRLKFTLDSGNPLLSSVAYPTTGVQWSSIGNVVRLMTNGNFAAQATESAFQLDVGNVDFLGLPVKTTTGDPSSPAEGYLYVNTADNSLRLYVDGGWQDVKTWT